MNTMWSTILSFSWIPLISLPLVFPKIKNLFLSPLRVEFDENNPYRQFWNLIMLPDHSGANRDPQPCWEYRVKITNLSKISLKNVRVQREFLGAMPSMPQYKEFYLDKSSSITLDPGCSDFVVIMLWPKAFKDNSKRTVGMLTGPSAWDYGPIRITVSAENVKSLTKLLYCNHEFEQLFFNKKPNINIE